MTYTIDYPSQALNGMADIPNIWVDNTDFEACDGPLRIRGMPVNLNHTDPILKPINLRGLLTALNIGLLPEHTHVYPIRDPDRPVYKTFYSPDNFTPSQHRVYHIHATSRELTFNDGANPNILGVYVDHTPRAESYLNVYVFFETPIDHTTYDDYGCVATHARYVGCMFKCRIPSEFVSRTDVRPLAMFVNVLKRIEVMSATYEFTTTLHAYDCYNTTDGMSHDRPIDAEIDLPFRVAFETVNVS